MVIRSVTNQEYPAFPGLEKDVPGGNLEVYKKLSQLSEKYMQTARYIVYAQLQYYSLEFAQMPTCLNKVLSGLKPWQRFIFLADVPMLDKNPLHANRGITYKGNKVNYEFIKLEDTVLNVLKNYRNAQYLDLSSDWVKQIPTYPYYKDTIMYYDGGHLNKYGSLTYEKITAPKMAEALKLP